MAITDSVVDPRDMISYEEELLRREVASKRKIDTDEITKDIERILGRVLRPERTNDMTGADLRLAKNNELLSEDLPEPVDMTYRGPARPEEEDETLRTAAGNPLLDEAAEEILKPTIKEF